MTWLCACCRNEIAGHFRKTMRPVREVDLAGGGGDLGRPNWAPPLPRGPRRAALRSETRRLVHVALDELPPHYGQVLEWKYLENLPVKEIADPPGARPEGRRIAADAGPRSLPQGSLPSHHRPPPPAEISRLQPDRMEIAL